MTTLWITKGFKDCPGLILSAASDAGHDHLRQEGFCPSHLSAHIFGADFLTELLSVSPVWGYTFVSPTVRNVSQLNKMVLKCFADGEMQAATAYSLCRPKLGPEHGNHYNILSPRWFPHLSVLVEKGCKASQTCRVCPESCPELSSRILQEQEQHMVPLWSFRNCRRS